MRGRPVIAAVLAAIMLLLLVASSSAQTPHTMNYQVMLTNDADEPLADQPVQLVFRLYDVDAGGGSLWDETHNTETNSIGVASVILGSVSPMSLLFDTPLWLQVEVDGDVMSPRRPLTAAPYALRARDADFLGGEEAMAYALDDDLWQPGTLNNPANPLEWTKLKNVPAGFADGVDDGSGGGIGGGGTTNYVPKFTDPTTIQNSNIYESGGQVAIGTTTTDGRLTVENAGGVPALIVSNTYSGQLWDVVRFERTENMTSGSENLLVLEAPEASTNGLFLRCTRVGTGGHYSPFWVDLDGGIYSISEMDITSDTSEVVDAYSYHASDDTRVISGVYGLGGGGSYNATGVYGESKPQDGYGYGGKFVGGNTGASGAVQPTGAGSYYGLYGTVTGGTGTNYGVYGVASGGSTNWAGYFAGDARVTGTFTNPGPVLEMDHPTDPENQYLRHALVASPEMKTVYDGTVVLSADGSVWVELPDWFEDLNSTFRYQLTPIGAPAPGLYVAETVSNGRFRIAGGEPGMTVSWQVTGVRHDATAKHRPLVVEEEKSAKDRGRYLSPEANGAPREAAIGHSDGK